MTKDELLNKKICLISLGCDKNTVDSERILYKLQQFGFQTVAVPEQAQIIIVNTCAFIEPARVESINTVLEMLNLKNKGAEKIVVVGCLPAKYKNDILQQLPGVDLMLGTHSDEKIISEICKLFNYVPNSFDLQKITPCSRVISTPKHYAFLKIADGCDNHCSYCTIPKIRGKYTSEPIENLVEEAKALAKQGVKELILVAQDVTRYGEDLYKKHMIVPLIKELSKIEGIKWLRLHYCYPEFFSDELIDEMATNQKVCKYVDIPIQHINNDILRAMNRASTFERVTGLIEKLRSKMPDVSIRTSIIVGFAGEGKKEFEQLYKFLEQYKLDNIGFFPYSREFDTQAYDFDNQVPEKEKQRRLKKLVKLQSEIQYQKNSQFLGKTLNCVCDDETADFYIMRSQYNSPEIDTIVYVDKACANCQLGEFYDIKITNMVEPFDLKGEVL